MTVIRRLNPIIRGWAAYYRTRYPARRSTFWIITCGGSSTSGPGSAIATSRRPGSLPGTSASSTRPGRTGGCSATATAAPTCTSSPGPRSSATRWSSPASPDDPALADYWAWRQHKRPLPINHTAQRLYRAQDGRCAICKAMLVPVEDLPQAPHQWETWLATTRKTIDVTWDHGNPDKAEPRLAHLRCHHGNGPTLQTAQPPARLARAGCSETGTSGSQGGPAPQGAGPTRHVQPRRRRRREAPREQECRARRPRRQETRLSPKPRLGACTRPANDRLDAEVSGDAGRASGSTKAEPSGRTGSGLSILLLWISSRPERQPVPWVPRWRHCRK